jgi:hypothetical protein
MQRGRLMALPVAGPTNRFLVPVRDRRWPRVLTTVLLAATILLLALLLVGWPRLKSTSVHYQVNRLRAEVRELEQQERALAIELAHERSPHNLAEQASQLGLAPPPASQVVAGVDR